MRFQPVPRRPDHVELERRILAFWQEGGFFRRLVERNRGGDKFRFLDGPITANNPMGVHHAWGRTIKDLFQRYQAMQGRDQRWQNGFDCQGLWVEVEVEKELGFKCKRDIETFGIDRFVEKCKERVLKYSAIQARQSVRLGQWMDWDNSYYTMSDENNYTIWHFLKKCHERGLIYEGTDVMPWCSRCGTAISDMEIATEGYRELAHKAVYLKLPVPDRGREALLVWTTTPWTLTANTAAAVHPGLDYVRARLDGETLILAEARLGLLGPGAEVVERLTGSALIGLRYAGPFDELAPQQGVEHRVIPWDEVSADDGTGIVHIAPGCGKEDFLLGREHGLAVIAPLDEDGRFRPEFGPFAGRGAAEVAPDVFRGLEAKGRLFKVEEFRHRYPVCWRCGDELVFRLVDEWFIAMDPVREEIMASARQVRWLPGYGLDRELDWLRNMSDWCISKKRYWGLALPIYRCACGGFEVIGSREELRERAVAGWERFDGHSPHRPWVDEVRIRCPKCGAEVSRVGDVGNPWLDAGIVPFSTTHYLTDPGYWRDWFPFDFITECFPGQFRNWFYAILAMSTVLEKQAPFKTLLGHALVKDEHGQDMHKSAGNAIPFEEAADRMGADVMRWVFLNNNPTQNLSFGYAIGREAERKLLTLWNVYSFLVTYAEIDGLNPAEINLPADRLRLLDRWIISRLDSLVRLCHERLDDYDPSAVPRAVEAFIDDLSTWYVRRNRRRFWKPAREVGDDDKLAAYQTLYTCLEGLVRLLAPFMPFLAEEIYRNLVLPCDPTAPESVHLCPYPEPDPSRVNEALEREVGMVRAAVSLGHSAREKAKLKVRQPLSAVIITAADEAERQAWLRHADVIREELNIREVLFTEPGAEFPADYEVARDDTRAVGINTRLTRELESEGLARELVNKIQNLRKQAGLEVTDRITLFCAADDEPGRERLAEALAAHREYITRETLTLNISSEPPAAERAFNLNGIKVRLALAREEKQ
ncbi:MAG: isoleucine--tRNA ligase [bacterium]